MNPIQAKSAASTAFAPSETRLKEPVGIPINGIALRADLVIPPGARGLALFTISKGCIHEPSRIELIARAIEAHGVATLTFPLLTEPEARKDGHFEYWSFDLDLLTHRLLQATSWAMRQPQTRDLGIGYVGTGTCASAALVAAAQLGYVVQAVVSRDGRPDLAGNSLSRVTAPTLLIVSERDEYLLQINQRAMEHLQTAKRLSVVAGAGHLFDEPGTLEQAADLTAEWLAAHLKPIERG
jgi:putative phosphoribosyl transferase